MEARDAADPVAGPFCRIEGPTPDRESAVSAAGVMPLSLAATIAGADDFGETTLWGAEHLAFLRQFCRYEKGIPSHDTLSDVFAALDPELFRACFLAWVDRLRDDDPDIVAIDGKTSRAAATGARAAIRGIWSRPGRRDSGSCSVSRRPKRNPTRSPPSPCCCDSWI